MNRIVQRCVEYPKVVTGLMVLSTLVIALVSILPSVWPQMFSSFYTITVDTDPENMLPKDEAERVFHHVMKREFTLHDMIVLGIVNDIDPNGVFNPASLHRVHELAGYAKTLHWPDSDQPGGQAGVIGVDLISPSTVDHLEQSGLGAVRFDWLMPEPPRTREDALLVRRKAERIPFFQGTVLSDDGRALALYLPITSSNLSYVITAKLREKIATFNGDEQYFITGLPVAKDTFGVEMFKQMAISAPVAMLAIFGLMFWFFRNVVLIISPMLVAMVSVIVTMGLLIATGQTIHIMSSMIPIFIMPIAVLDAVHLLSEFFDRYPETRDRRQTLLDVMGDLTTPMLYTSLTTAVGFASLAFTPIPPVRVFGLFVALGVIVAWFWTITFIPAFVMLIRPQTLEGFGLTYRAEDGMRRSRLTRLLMHLGQMTDHHAKRVVGLTVVVMLIAAYGIGRIVINDNPIKWFTPSHPIRVADQVLNTHFGGTYMAYLALTAPPRHKTPSETAQALATRLAERAAERQALSPQAATVFQVVQAESRRLDHLNTIDQLDAIEAFIDTQRSQATEAQHDAWNDALRVVDQERQNAHIFKHPQVLAYMAELEAHLLTTGVVGKSNSLATLVKTVHRELRLGHPEAFNIPATSHGVAQTLLTWQNSHRPQDLWRFVTPDYRNASIWVQLQSGDNQDMAAVVRAVDHYIVTNPPPVPLTHQWFGSTYINLIWQQKMVSGMLKAFLGSFVIVLIMMTILFRSLRWGLLSMVPLTLTITVIYGVIGWIGKDYDMPVAVLSSLSLGLAIDYAIHFLARSRALHAHSIEWSQTSQLMFGEPSRAIARNMIVVGAGFLPLLLAPLVPYQTVGVVIAAILLIAGMASLLLLPALLTCFESWFFPASHQVEASVETLEPTLQQEQS